jgi:hypothetical protein
MSKLRLFTFGPLAFALFAAPLGMGCAAPTDDTASADQEVVTTAEGKIKNEAIGNCWLYAAGSWVESTHKAATGEEIDVSETYWSYWDWYMRITGGEVTGTTMETGGFWQRAALIMQDYGYMNEAEFVPADTKSDTQNIQATALAAVQKAFAAGGALATPAQRKNGTTVRKVLNTAFGLSATVVSDLDTTFGKSGTGTLAKAKANAKSKVRRPSSLNTGNVQGADGKNHAVTLADFIGTGDQYTRTGPYVWQPIDYPSDAAGRRQAQIRVQKALNMGWTVLMQWYVDFNALDATGHFMAPPAKPGFQGGHYSVLADYQIDNVPGFGTLAAGVNATPAQLQASLDPNAKIAFFRTKNSWGDYQSLATMKGYYDIYEAYFDSDFPQCQTDANEQPILSSCTPGPALGSFVIPSGL